MRTIAVLLLMAHASTAEVFRVDSTTFNGFISAHVVELAVPARGVEFNTQAVQLSMTYMLTGREMLISSFEIAADTLDQVPPPFPLPPADSELKMRDVRLSITEPVMTRPGNELLIPLVVTGQFEGEEFEATVEGSAAMSHVRFDVDGSSIFFSSTGLSWPLSDKYLLDEIVSVGSANYEPTAMIAGDADHDGGVTFADFVILRNNFGQRGNWELGDFDFDGYVQFPDFVILATNFGLSAAAPVPEPSLNFLLLSELLGVVVFLPERQPKYARFHRGLRHRQRRHHVVNTSFT